MNIAIIGAGVGGLTFALFLLKNGIKNISIYESSSTISELGVGINILPHAMRAMEQIGLLNDLVNASVETPKLEYYTQNGQLIWQETRGKEAGYRWPQISIHRAYLIQTLYKAVKERLGVHNIHLNHKLKKIEQHGHKVTAIFNNKREEFDCLVGCDGIHSTVRKTFYPDEGPPKWDGITMWRGASLMPQTAEKKPMIIAGRSENRMVVYPISKHSNTDGKILINWVVKHKTSKNQTMPRQDWIHKVDVKEMPNSFNKFEFLQYSKLRDNAEAIYKYPQVDRDPVSNWAFGTITLLGDAAHPMYPSGSNGASQAILDAEALASQLEKSQNIEQAITHYDQERRPATSKIVLNNRLAGPERCIDIVEDRSPNGFKQLSDVISHKELSEISNSYKKTAGFEKSALNKNIEEALTH